MATTRPDTQEATLRWEADHILAKMRELKSEDETLYWIATNVLGTIRDSLQAIVYELDALHTAAEERGIWDEDDEEVPA